MLLDEGGSDGGFGRQISHSISVATVENFDRAIIRNPRRDHKPIFWPGAAEGASQPLFSPVGAEQAPACPRCAAALGRGVDKFFCCLHVSAFLDCLGSSIGRAVDS